jgi:F-type H+-transporting ATPase subunit gamma
MESLSAIKRRMRTVGSIAKATNAIKMVATVKLSRVNMLHKFSMECSSRLLRMLSIAIAEARYNDLLQDDFWTERKNGKSLVIVLSTDQGFCGSFNQSIAEAAKRTISDSRVEYIEVFGKKVVGIAQNKAIPHGRSKDFAKTLSDLVVEYVRHRNVSRVTVISVEKKNAMVQIVKCTNVLPLDIDDAVGSECVTIEGPVQDFIDEVFEMYTTSLFKNLLSKHWISEFSARVIAMDNSVNNANDMCDKLNILYNNIRQTKITQELTEIVSSMECVR